MPGTARKTWQRVCERKAREAAERRAKQRPVRVPTPKANAPPPRPAPVQPRSPPSWVMPPAPFAPSHSRPPAGEPDGSALDPERTIAAALARFKKLS